MYLVVLVIAEHLDNILFCHYSKILKNSFKYESLAIFAGKTQKYSCPPLLVIQGIPKLSLLRKLPTDVKGGHTYPIFELEQKISPFLVWISELLHPGWSSKAHLNV